MKRTHRGKVSRGIYRKIGLLFIIVCLFAVCASLSYIEANQIKNVLVLHSYHKGLGWTDRITQGIESALLNSDQEIGLYLEYMDTKRIHDAQHFQNLYELYRHKFRNRRFDLVVSSDDHAFNFLLAHHQELFPDTPIVFCGVNDFKDSMLVGHNLITGAVESFDIKGTIDVALQLHPNAKEVFVIVDKTLSGTIVKELMIKDIPYFKDVLRFTFLEDIDMSEVLERVENLSRDSIVFLISLLTDISGNTFSFKKSCALISEYSAVPIYSHSGVYFGHGILGGMLNSGDAQGKMAGEMALRILQGEKVKNIPVVKKSPNRYKFDYQQMQRFGTKLSSLPEGSTVINRPYSFYSEHNGLVWSVVACIAGLVLIVLILSATIISRKQAEERLRENQEKLAGIVASVTDPMSMMDEEYNIVWANDVAKKLFGPELVGKKCYAAYHWYDKPCEPCIARKCFEDGKAHEHETEVIGADGNKMTFWCTASVAARDKDGRPKMVVEVSRDITERKAFQAEVMRAGHLASLGELAAGVAHEINNPINGVINYAQILVDHSDEKGEVNEIAGRIIKEGDRIADIVRNLLTFARDWKEEQGFALIPDILADSLGLVEKQILKDGISLKVDIPPDLPGIKARKHQIQQVFMNIISNARHALKQRFPGFHEDKILEIKSEVVEIEGRSHVRTTFYDRGTGIPADILDRICDPFFSTKGRGVGTGLGLSISYGIIEDHGGKLSFDSVEGEYTKVMVDLPVD